MPSTRKTQYRTGIPMVRISDGARDDPVVGADCLFLARHGIAPPPKPNGRWHPRDTGYLAALAAWREEVSALAYRVCEDVIEEEEAEEAHDLARMAAILEDYSGNWWPSESRPVHWRG